MDKVTPVIHLKTGKLYFAHATVLNCTNAQADQKMVLYSNMEGKQFVRECKEFWQKFQAVDDYYLGEKYATKYETEVEKQAFIDGYQLARGYSHK